jgi:long-chain acyl-CoA synthetase
VEYYKNAEATATPRIPRAGSPRAMPGIEEESGQLRIIDRAKDVGKMADGRLFAPKYVENKLKFFPTSWRPWSSAMGARCAAPSSTST